MAAEKKSLLAQAHTLFLEAVLTLLQVFVQPFLSHLSLWNSQDPTYGRAKLPFSPTENRLIYENRDVKSRQGKAWLDAEAIQKSSSWQKANQSFVHYYVWELPSAQAKEKLNADVFVIHGINDYAGKLAPHALKFMESGFRVIAIDLPSFGRSSGLHAYVPSMRLLVEALHTVICDVQKEDAESNQAKNRKIFLEGHSMGAFTALYYASLYGKGGAEEPAEGSRINGVAVAAPMIAISAQSRPHFLVELVAKALAFFAGRLPLAAAVKGNVSDDPRVEEEHVLDPQTYHGKLRIATGLAILAGLIDLQLNASKINVPVVIHHGDKDRATSHKGSIEFIEKIGSQDKTLRIWKGYEHVMMKFVTSGGGMIAEDKAKTSAVLEDINAWLLARAKAQ